MHVGYFEVEEVIGIKLIHNATQKYDVSHEKVIWSASKEKFEGVKKKFVDGNTAPPTDSPDPLSHSQDTSQFLLGHKYLLLDVLTHSTTQNKRMLEDLLHQGIVVGTSDRLQEKVLLNV